MSTLKDKLTADMKDAMRSGDKDTRDALRLILAAVKQEAVDSGADVDDAGVIKVLNKQAKQRRESIADFEKAGRPELGEPRKVELDVIQSYLPKMMDRDEVAAIVSGAIAELGITDMKGKGQLMGKVMPQLKGKADGRLVNEVVSELLG